MPLARVAFLPATRAKLAAKSGSSGFRGSFFKRASMRRHLHIQTQIGLVMVFLFGLSMLVAGYESPAKAYFVLGLGAAIGWLVVVGFAYRNKRFFIKEFEGTFAIQDIAYGLSRLSCFKAKIVAGFLLAVGMIITSYLLDSENLLAGLLGIALAFFNQVLYGATFNDMEDIFSLKFSILKDEALNSQACYNQD